MHAPYQAGTPLTLSLSPWMLPHYAAHTVLRMLIAFICSLVVTFTLAPLAAKNKQAEKCLIPLIDILQSVPILGVLSMTFVFFINLFPNQRLGPECAAIFAIFTSQVWNMILSFYQSLKTVPKTFYDISAIFHLSAWQRFWRVEVPYAIPGLLWNSMISTSAGWFFLVAAEAISVNNQQIMLPGIGSYISLAISHRDLSALFYATFSMFIVILCYDQLFFRPLLSWAARFQDNDALENNSTSRSWVYQLLLKTRWIKKIHALFKKLSQQCLNPSDKRPCKPFKAIQHAATSRQIVIYAWNTIVIGLIGVAVFMLWRCMRDSIRLDEIPHVFYLGAITTCKVGILVMLCSLLWIPVGVWIGFRPKLTHRILPIIQFLAAFPANLVYPLFVTLILRFHLNVNLWTSPLMILGTQWYILFNVIAGTMQIPKDLQWAAKSLRLKGWLWWKKMLLPAIFPYYITGSMTAAAGCWNASIVSDVLSWGDHTLIATGLGSYIALHSHTGDFSRVTLGIVVMCFYVLVINRLLWRPLYTFSSARFVLE
ncbi:MAG: ABC transporter permease subunit [Gammaproteobacteria bacterium]|nr:ABC transporter permease subunit [Gammaproteobacteria bacterium]MBP9728888.1 ABC transporter permease subunit [Gammaproteobacteria bacterium]